MKKKLIIIGGIWLAIGAYYAYKNYNITQNADPANKTAAGILKTIISGPMAGMWSGI
jgi:hypothetical protein